MRAKRTEPEKRKQQILSVAIRLAIKIGYANLSRDIVAKSCKVSPALVSRYFPTVELLKRAVIREALRTNNMPIAAQVFTTMRSVIPLNMRGDIIHYLTTL
jgi:AcrR family transcriptional regulator